MSEKIQKILTVLDNKKLIRVNFFILKNVYKKVIKSANLKLWYLYAQNMLYCWTLIYKKNILNLCFFM